MPSNNEDLVRSAIAQQRDSALNALAFAHAEIAQLKQQIEDLRARLRGDAQVEGAYE
ncbi:MAG TPA: hypothetical protein VL522_23360 [Bordetella sp.]|nr:hypothetical protein [Bordetella sp.]